MMVEVVNYECGAENKIVVLTPPRFLTEIEYRTKTTVYSSNISMINISVHVMTKD